jgi:hypothetical protein
MAIFTLTRENESGNIVPVTVIVNSSESYFNYIENYKGNDLLSDLILQDFVIDMFE